MTDKTGPAADLSFLKSTTRQEDSSALRQRIKELEIENRTLWRVLEGMGKIYHFTDARNKQ